MIQGLQLPCLATELTQGLQQPALHSLHVLKQVVVYITLGTLCG
jgi:hypothetical protein